jgi:hypothetical protein
VLETRLGEQFYEDGGSVEQSTFYHHATLGFYVLADLLARENGDTTAPAIRAAIERARDLQRDAGAARRQDTGDRWRR